MKTRIAIWGMMLLLTGCGFHLRGDGFSTSSLSALPPVYLQSGNPQGGVMVELQRHGHQRGARFTTDSSEAEMALNIGAENFERRVLSVGSTGKVREFALHYSVSFSVLDKEGKELMTDSLKLVRDYRFDETQVLGKEAEENQLRQDMLRDAAQQIMRRLRSVSAK